jgi:hypothetical protein
VVVGTQDRDRAGATDFPCVDAGTVGDANRSVVGVSVYTRRLFAQFDLVKRDACRLCDAEPLRNWNLTDISAASWRASAVLAIPRLGDRRGAWCRSTSRSEAIGGAIQTCARITTATASTRSQQAARARANKGPKRISPAAIVGLAEASRIIRTG